MFSRDVSEKVSSHTEHIQKWLVEVNMHEQLSFTRNGGMFTGSKKKKKTSVGITTITEEVPTQNSSSIYSSIFQTSYLLVRFCCETEAHTVQNCRSQQRTVKTCSHAKQIFPECLLELGSSYPVTSALLQTIKKKHNFCYASCTNTTPNLENKAMYQFGK